MEETEQRRSWLHGQGCLGSQSPGSRPPGSPPRRVRMPRSRPRRPGKVLYSPELPLPPLRSGDDRVADVARLSPRLGAVGERRLAPGARQRGSRASCDVTAWLWPGSHGRGDEKVPAVGHGLSARRFQALCVESDSSNDTAGVTLSGISGRDPTPRMGTEHGRPGKAGQAGLGVSAPAVGSVALLTAPCGLGEPLAGPRCLCPTGWACRLL